MSDSSKTPKTQAAVMFLVSLVLLFALVSGRHLTSGQTLWLLGGTIALGLVVAVGELEDLLGDRFVDSRGLRYAGAALTAMAVFASRIESVGDVNHIFRVDASALPLTVWAGTAIHMARLFFYPLVGAAGIAAISLAFQFFRRHKEGEAATETAEFARSLAIVLSCGLSAMIIQFQLNDDEWRRATIYRIAQSSDFSGSFRCSGVSEEGMVGLFIGPEQRRIMLAKKIDEPEMPAEKDPRLLPKLAERPTFLTVDCIAPSAAQ